MRFPCRCHRRWVRVLALAVLFAGTAAWFVPPTSALYSTLPVGQDAVATVPLFNVWTIWWNCDRLQHGFQGYWDAPIFHPEPNAFAFSDPQPATILVSPVLWLSGSRTLAYNLYLGLSLALNGLVTAGVLLSLGRRLWLSILGGVAMVLLPIVHAQIDVVQLIPIWAIVWTWSAFRRVGEFPTWSRGCEAGLAVGVSFAMSVHHGLFLVLLLMMGPAAILPIGWKRKGRIRSTLVAGAVGSLLVLPLVLPMSAALSAHGFERSHLFVTNLSAHPSDYLAVSKPSILQWNADDDQQRFQLSPGWFKLALAGIGLLSLLVRRRRRRWTAFLAATALLAFLLSLGPNLEVGAWQPWWTLTDWCPGFAQVRSAFRFAYFVQIAIVMLAIEGLHLLSVVSHRWPRARRIRTALGAVVVVLGLVAALESLPRRAARAGTPSAAANQEWIDFIRRETPPQRAIACVPFAPSNSVQDFDQTTRWMYYGTYHGIPLVNGYSGFFPKSNESLREAMNQGFTSLSALDRLAAAHVEFVVVHESSVETPGDIENPSGVHHLQLVSRTATGVAVYRLITDAPDENRFP